MGDTSIEWTDKTWNPIRGCSVVGPECENCYAMGFGARFSKPGEAYDGIAKFSAKRRLPQWTGVVRPVPDHLDDPIRWRHPKRVFVNSQSDLFHERLPRAEVAAVLGVMALASHHTYQVLTKRAARMAELLASITLEEALDEVARRSIGLSRAQSRAITAGTIAKKRDMQWEGPLAAPPWAWFGVSVGIRSTLHRLDALRATPAALRFVSFEPLLEDLGDVDLRGIDWAIVGGESGNRARPCNVAWIRRIVARAATSSVPCFVKQLGAAPYHVEPDPPGFATASNGDIGRRVFWSLVDDKGGDPTAWPHDLRIRLFPEAR